VTGGRSGKGGGVPLYWLVAWPALFALWLVLAGTVSPSEIVAGAIATTLSVGTAEVIRKQGVIGFRPRARWLVRAARIPWRTVSDLALVIAALWRRAVLRRRVRGRFRAEPFPCAGDDPVAAARRALVTVGLSAPPNTYVVDLDHQHDRLVIHELVPSRGSVTDLLA
jgi:hypothetical protein